MPAFQPYRGKPAVRNDGEGRGNVGIIRSPVRASTLPDCGGRAMKRTSLPLQRREFITLLGGAAAAWPLAARAQQGERMRRIGVLIHLSEAHPAGQRYVAVFRQGLKELGWTDGGNVRIDVRWIAGDLERLRSYPGELVALAPDVILTTYTPGVLAVQRTSRTVPIVFVGVIDPVGSGLVKSLARPGGNATGFLVFEYSI